MRFAQRVCGSRKYQGIEAERFGEGRDILYVYAAYMYIYICMYIHIYIHVYVYLFMS